jgi:hypothetical protein
MECRPDPEDEPPAAVRRLIVLLPGQVAGALLLGATLNRFPSVFSALSFCWYPGGGFYSGTARLGWLHPLAIERSFHGAVSKGAGCVFLVAQGQRGSQVPSPFSTARR